MTKEHKISNRMKLKERVYRRRFIFPNLVTLGNMFCGFLAIFYAFNGNFKKAILSIIFATVLDGLDGRVARKFNACTQFGLELDSLSDLVSFGIAPAILFYNWGMAMHFKEVGILIAFIYVVCAASRLARFNCTEENLKSFQGLPSPAAAFSVLSIVYAFYKEGVPTYMFSVIASVIFCYISFLMISNYKFLSIKLLKMSSLREKGVLFIAIFIALMWIYPKQGFLLISFIYCISGPIVTFFDKRKNKEIRINENVEE